MSKPSGFSMIWLMCLGIFVCMIDTTIMNIALPAIQTDLHVSLEAMSWMLNVYTMSMAVLSIPLARLAEIWGKGKFFVLGALLFGAGSALCGLADSGSFLIAARFVQSLGAAVLMPISFIIGVGAVPVDKRHLALGLLGGTQGLAAALGPTVGGIITQTFGWQWVFYVNVPICLLAVFAATRMLQLRGEERVKVRIDLPGMLLSSAAIFLLTLVLIKGNAWGWTSGAAWGCYAGSVIAFLLFVWVEMRAEQPMIDLRLFRHRQFTGASLVTIASGVAMIGVTVLLPQFLTHFQEKSELDAALLVTPISATIFVMAPLSGMLARKIGNVLSVLLGFLLLGTAYVLLQGLNLGTSSAQVILDCVLVGAGYGLIIGPMSVASAADFEGEMLTASQSATQFFRQLGIVLAVAIFIAGLTHQLDAKKALVSGYLEERVQALDVPEELRAKVREGAETRLKGAGLVAEEQSATIAVPAAERERLIEENVSKALASVPDDRKEQARPQVLAQVTEQIDAALAKTNEQLESFGKDLAVHAKSTLASSFAALYQGALPFVFGCVLLSLFFARKQRFYKKIGEEQRVS